jgi:hypothetical protein
LRSLRVYIAGPYTAGCPVKNTAIAIEAGNKVLELGHTPFIPHLNMLWDLHKPHPPYVWLAWDKEWLKVCHALIRLPGKSPGADEEVRMAQEELHIPVFFGVDAFDEWLVEQEKEN